LYLAYFVWLSETVTAKVGHRHVDG